MARTSGWLIVFIAAMMSLLALWVALAPDRASGQGPLPDKFQFSIDNQAPPGRFRFPRDVAVAPNGDIYILDTADNRVQRFSANGVFLAAWGSRGSADGQLSQPHGIAVGLDGTVYIADGGHRRVLRFSPDGRYLGVLPSEFDCYDDPYHVDCGPYDVAVGPVYIYASDPYSQSFFGPAVDLFTPQGAFAGRIWLEEDAEEPEHIAVAPDGSIYVNVTPDSGADNAIQHFSADLDYLGQWEIDVAGVDYVDVEGLAVAPDGTVYVTLFTSGGSPQWLRRYSPSGQLLGEWSQPSGGRPFARLGDLSITSAGTLLVPDASAVLRLDRDARLLGEVGAADTTGHWPVTSGLAFANDNTLLSVGRDHVQRWSTHGELRDTWPLVTPSGPIPQANDIGVAPDGSIYVVDTARSHVFHFSATGAFLHQWGSQGAGDGQFNSPRAVAVGPDASVYVADTYNSRVQRFSATGEFLGKTALSHPDARPWDLSVAPDGSVYVGHYRIERFSATLQALGAWDGPPDTPFFAVGIDVAPDGTLYVTTSEPDRVYRYSATGDPLGHWGTLGDGPGEFTFLSDVAVAPDGRVFIADGNRIQVFGTETPTTWRVQVYDNDWLGDTPVVITDTLTVTLDGLVTGPIPPSTGVSARFERRVSLPEGDARVALQAQGGVRLWLGDNLLIDQWDAPEVSYTALLPTHSGDQPVRLEVRPRGDTPALHFDITAIVPHRLFLPLVQSEDLQSDDQP